MSIAANKVKGVYALSLSDVYSAQRAASVTMPMWHAMGAFTSGKQEQEMMTEAFLSNEFVRDAHQPKVEGVCRR